MSPPTPVQWRLRVPNTEQIELRLGLAIKPNHPTRRGLGGLKPRRAMRKSMTTGKAFTIRRLGTFI